MADNANFEIRSATPADAVQIAEIYRPYVEDSVTSFEVEAPVPDEITVRILKTQQQEFPYIVAAVGDEIAGYAYTSVFRARAAYRNTVECSVYVRADYQRRGIGKALLLELIRLSEASGKRQMIAVISDPEHSVASVTLHASLGFRGVGVFAEIGEKFGQQWDVLMMQRSLDE